MSPASLSLDGREARAEAIPGRSAPAAEAMRDAYLDSVEDVEISGVRVQVCTPRGYDPSRDDRAVLYFFGGGSVVGSPLEDLAISARLAQSLGLKIYAPYYRLAPEYPFPTALDDGAAVSKALAGAFAPGNQAVAGESAGGNLAAATGGEVGRQLPRLHLPARDVAGNRHAAFPTRQVRPTRSD